MVPTIDTLEPLDRESAQGHYVRAYHGRRRRQRFAETREIPARVTYDMAGRIVAVKGKPVLPHVSSWAEDHATRAY